MTAQFGNPSNTYRLGLDAKQAVVRSMSEMASPLNR
jgi:cysteine sulfinate desulfinase/cysteine desulfurase-like protein